MSVYTKRYRQNRLKMTNQYNFMKRRLLDMVWVERGAKQPRDSQLELIEKEITTEKI